MGEEVIDNEVEDIETTEDEGPSAVERLVDKIIDDDNVGAIEDFEAILADKLNAALDQKKIDVARSIYSNDDETEQGDEETEEEETEQPEE